MIPNKPEHADRDYPIPGVDLRLTVRRHLVSYAYPANGNVHNPTPEYDWHLVVDGVHLVDTAHRKRDMVEAARTAGAEYLREIDARV